MHHDNDKHVGRESIKPFLEGVDNWLFPVYQSEQGPPGVWGRVIVPQLQGGGLGTILRVGK